MSDKSLSPQESAPTVDQVVTNIVSPLVSAMDRERRSGLRKVIDLGDGRMLSLTVSRRRRAKVKPMRNVPETVSRLTDAFQRVYVGLRLCRLTKAPDQEVTAVHVHKAVAEQIEGELALETVYRGLKKLIHVNAVRKVDATGYHIGVHTVEMAFSDGQSELPVQRKVEAVESLTVN